ncbi:MAG: tetratricopeptide repeat protein [Magnetococcales bacterium]|nr:tetratricopeptide repeat protein [Magnetococcales bacterium]
MDDLMKLFQIILLGLLVIFQASSVSATPEDALDRILSLADQEKYQEATDQLDRFLHTYPTNPQGQFLHGLLLTHMGKHKDAIRIFKQLTEAYPELPEPYNNLAVLYAEQGDLEQARMALLRAIKTDPVYSTALDNLGDIYALMATSAYTKALKMSKDSEETRAKLNLVNQLTNRGDGNHNSGVIGAFKRSEKTQPSAARVAHKSEIKSALVTSSSPTPIPVHKSIQKPVESTKTAEIKPATQSLVLSRTPPVYPGKAQKLAPVVSPRRVVQAPTPAPAMKPPVPKPVQRRVVDKAAQQQQLLRQEIQNMVSRWATDWSAQKISGYTSHYAPNFRGMDAETRRVWEKKRSWVLSRPKYIRVQVSNLKTVLRGNDQAEATFMQDYRSDRYHDRVSKTLFLQKKKGRWKIVQERSNGG